jgi:hypothetical protein
MWLGLKQRLSSTSKALVELSNRNPQYQNRSIYSRWKLV